MFLFYRSNMPNVSFYILNSQNIKDYFKTIVQLTVKAYEAKNHVLIHSHNPSHLQLLDNYLWTYKPTSFIPHTVMLTEEIDSPIETILLADFIPKTECCDLLIQLASQVPEQFNHYQRVIEVLYDEPAHLAQGRERFKFYRQHGIEPQTIKL